MIEFLFCFFTYGATLNPSIRLTPWIIFIFCGICFEKVGFDFTPGIDGNWISGADADLIKLVCHDSVDGNEEFAVAAILS